MFHILTNKTIVQSAEMALSMFSDFKEEEIWRGSFAQNGGNRMGLFGFMKGKKGSPLGAPIKGECIPICEVADPTFAEEILGKGIAIKPVDGKVFAPADGTISTLFPTGHAVGITTEEGAEVLIHVGLDTVELKGEHFQALVEVGQKVKMGECLLEADLEAIRKAGYDTVTPVLICNSDEFPDIERKTEGIVDVGEEIMTYK